ncbi:penicillin-binding transpeptidase domain-containing protein [Salinithrix halophila]|uniref:Penicillin-binding transpeptidase domain-containing protein n=1 Tax=Salinithrix halophila TaxID=1485204 RepID=A0ABV8JH37_9BACL
MSPTSKQSKLRSLFVGITFIFLLTAVIFRLFWIQTVDASFLRERAGKTWEKRDVIKPKRGSIKDRKGNDLVEEVRAYIIAADLKRIDDPRKTAKKLSPLLDIPEDVLYQKLTKKGINQVELKNGGNYKVLQEKRDKIMALGLDGIYAIQTTGRNYLEGKLAAHVLGFVNVEGDPAGGLEQKYDKLLRGRPGKIRFKKDALGIKVPNSAEEFQPPQQGKDLVLTLNREIQSDVERQLDQVMARYRAKGATAIVADPKTGEILAMANRPNFNPNHYAETWRSGWNDTNIAISSQFEPGSTFKIVTLAAAIEENVFQSDQRFQSGSIEVGGGTIRDWNNKGWGKITYADGVNLSSNVAFVHLGEKLGADRLERYIDRFGFGRITDRSGQPTGIDLQAEGRGYFFGHKPLHKLELATTAFGQGIAVTPIQQVMAVTAIANGGTLYRPHVVKKVVDPTTDAVVKENQPFVVRRDVVSKETAAKVRELLRGVVLKGTGKEAELPGYEVAGKTGTAQKPKQGGKGYAPGQYMVSFVGFAPAKNPRVVVYVAVDEPKGSGHGGTVAAPAAREIIKDSLLELGVKPTHAREGATAKAHRTPGMIAEDWVGRPVNEVKRSLEKKGVRAQVLGGGKKVVAQYPTDGSRLTRDTAYLLTENTEALEMPDLRGKTLREAMDICRLLDLDSDPTGEGFVIGQSITPGDRIMDQKRISLKLEPPKWQ